MYPNLSVILNSPLKPQLEIDIHFHSHQYLSTIQISAPSLPKIILLLEKIFVIYKYLIISYSHCKLLLIYFKNYFENTMIKTIILKIPWLKKNCLLSNLTTDFEIFNIDTSYYIVYVTESHIILLLVLRIFPFIIIIILHTLPLL